MDTTETVAIVGLDCRFPGADSPEEFWKVLLEAENHVKEIPKDRWNSEAYYDADRTASGKTYAKHAGLLKDIHMWDNNLFGINEMEAERMDPQHKLALEVSYRALEDGGFTLDDVRGTNTAVYIGVMNADYSNLVTMDPEFADNYAAAGNANSMLANRLSYFYDVRGESLTLDTACSSGLMAVHLGARNILAGKSDMAICGGVNVILSPTTFVSLSKANMASETGQCQTYTVNADGYARSEGCGIVLLKHLRKAREEGDKIWGVISCVSNSDGKCARPITSPSSEMQVQLIESAMTQSKLKPHQIQFVEMHGTGTPVGDPVETSAVGKVIGRARKDASMDPCPVGSVKTNIGHTEAAAGMAGLIKVLLMMKRKTLAPSVLFGKLKESLNIEPNCLEVLEKSKEWPASMLGSECVRIASINSFGFGGSNVHAIVQSTDNSNPVSKAGISSVHNIKPKVVTFSGLDQKALKDSMQATCLYINSTPDVSLEYIASTSYNNRKLYPYRAAIAAKSLEELKKTLKRSTDGNALLGRKVQGPKNQNVVFVFCGMGTHWNDMGSHLYDTEGAYRETIDNLQAIFKSVGNLDLKQCLAGNHDLADPKFGQPALFACQVALFNLWKASKVEPSVIVGHSVGEVAAAYASGGLSLEEAVCVIVNRGRVVSQATEGGMLAIGNLETTKVQEILKSYKGKLEIAAFNSPTSCAVSGDVCAIEHLQAYLLDRQQKPLVHRLAVKVAYHSFHMNHLLVDFKESLIEAMPPQRREKQKNLCVHISTVTGSDSRNGVDFRSPEYWLQNVRHSVQFCSAFSQALDAQKNNIAIEIGPKPALRSYIQEIGSGVALEHAGSLAPGKDQMFYQSLSKCYELGIVKRSTNRQVLTTHPKYAFQKTFLYKEPEIATELRQCQQQQHFQSAHPFVRAMLKNGIIKTVAKISSKSTPFVFEHKLHDKIIIPGATYVEICFAVYFLKGEEDSEVRRYSATLGGIGFTEAKFLQNQTTELEMQVNQFAHAHGQSVEITHGGRTYACANIWHAKQKNRCLELDTISQCHDDTFIGSDLYITLGNYGFEYGPSLRCVKGGTMNENECLVELLVPDGNDLQHTFFHPCVLDCILQTGIIFPGQAKLAKHGQIIPYGIQSVSLYEKLCSPLYAYLRVADSQSYQFAVDATVTNRHGVVLAECSGITYGVSGKVANFRVDDHIFHLHLQPLQNHLPNEEEPDKTPRILTIRDESCKFSFHNTRVEDHQLTLTEHDFEKMWEDSSVLESILPENLQSLDALLFTVGLHNAEVDLVKVTGEKMQQLVLRSCFTMLQVVKHLGKQRQACGLYIVTTGVYSLLDCQSSTAPINALLGNAILGMSRSINKENPMFPLRVVDLANYSTENLSTLAHAVKDNSDYFEFAICDGSLSYGTLGVAPPKKPHASRLLDISHNQNVRVLSSNQDKSLLLKPGNSSKPGMTLTSVRLLQNDFSHIDDDPNGLTEVLCVDAIGENDNGRHHICKLQAVCSTADVIESHTLPLRLFPCRYPCLSYCLVLWKVMRKLEQGISCSFVAKNVSPIWNIIALAISNLLGLTIEMNSVKGSARCTVLVTKNVTRDANALPKSLSSVHVISLNQTLERPVPKHITLKSLTFACNVLSVAKVEKTIATFRSWLQTLDPGKLNSTLNCVEMEIRTVSENITLSDFKFQNPVEKSKPTFLALEKNGEPACTTSHVPGDMFKASAGYILVGGRTGLLYEIVKHIAYLGAGYIGIVSRSGLDAKHEKEIKALEKEHGCTVVDIKADASNMDFLKKAFEKFREITGVEIKGIMYGAAVTRDSIIPSMTLSDFKAALAPKVAGVWNVYTLTKHMKLDIFMMHSSITSLFGNAGQTNYAAGNAFKDAVACLRRSETGVGQSVCWGALELGILEENQKAKDKLRSFGISAMTLAEIKACFDHLLIHNKPVLAYAKFLWPQWHRWMTTAPPLLSKQYDSLIKRKCHYIATSRQVSVNDIAAYSKSDKEYVMNVVQKVTCLNEEDMELSLSLASLGADSQDRQKIYAILMKDIGFTDKDLQLQDMADITLKDLIALIQKIKSLNGNNNPDVRERVETIPRKNEVSTNILFAQEFTSVDVPENDVALPQNYTDKTKQNQQMDTDGFRNTVVIPRAHTVSNTDGQGRRRNSKCNENPKKLLQCRTVVSPIPLERGDDRKTNVLSGDDSGFLYRNLVHMIIIPLLSLFCVIVVAQKMPV